VKREMTFKMEEITERKIQEDELNSIGFFKLFLGVYELIKV